MAPSPKKPSSFLKALRAIVLVSVLAVTTFAQDISALRFNVAPALADDSTFSAFFENCSDDVPEETTWATIKACLNRDGIEEPKRTLWRNVIKVPFFAFFDNHGSGTAAGIPPAAQQKPFMYGATPPSNSDQDAKIDIYLREGSTLDGVAGMDGLQELGDIFDRFTEDDINRALCSLLDIGPGGPSRNTNELPAPYAGLVSYGTNGDGDAPACSSREEVLSSSETPYGVRGLAAAMVFMMADIGNRGGGAMGDMMGSLQEYMVNSTGTTYRPGVGTSRASPNDFIDLTAFFTENYLQESIIGGTGPIAKLMRLCQRETAVSPANTYLTRLKNCYNENIDNPAGGSGSSRAVGMSGATRQFTTQILIPAIESLSSTPASQIEALAAFMNSSDFMDLADGYDLLAIRRQAYSLEDYFDETLNEGYLEYSAGVTDSDQVSIGAAQRAAAPTESTAFIAVLNNAVSAPVLRHLKAVNQKLIEQATVYLDAPLPTPPAAATPPTTPAATGGNVGQQNTQTFQAALGNVVRTQSDTKKSALEQLNSYIDRTALAASPKPALIGLWYGLATNDHQPNYQPEPITHITGDLELLIDERDATGVISWFTDPYLGRLMNACSPNIASDTISKDDLPLWKLCLQHEAAFVDGSNANNEFTLILSRNFQLTVTSSSDVMLSMARAPATARALQSLISRVDACIANPLCLSLNEEDEATATNREAGHEVDGVDVGNQLLNTILSFINVILALLIKFCFWLSALVMSLFQAVLNYTGFTTSSFVVTMWKAIRDFVNLFFILALLGIAIANIVQYEINNYAIKTILPKLILIVIAVNFSRLFVGIVIDATNVIEAGVYQVGGMGPHGGGTEARCSQLSASQVAAGGWKISTIPDDVKEGSVLCRLARGLKFEEMQRYAISNNANQPGRQIDFFFANMALFMMVVMLMFGFLALSITFTIRIIVLWALAITSPLYVVSKLSPLTASIGGQWQSKFFKYASMHIGVAFFMTLAVLAADSVVPQIFTAAMQQPGLIAGSQLGPSGFQSIADYLKLIFIIAMVYAGVFTAAKGDYAQGMIDKVASWGSPSALGGYAKKGLGLGYGLTQAAGNRLQDVRSFGAFGSVLRGLGSVISAPSNVGSGAKNIYESFQKEAKERSARFGLERATNMSTLLGSRRKEKMRSLLAQHRETQVAEIEKLDSIRYESKKIIRELLDQSISSGDSQSLLARARILASRGDLNLEQIMANKKSLRDNLKGLAIAGGANPEEVGNIITNLEDSNYSSIASKAAKEEQRASKTGETVYNLHRLKDLRGKQQSAEMVGLLGQVLASGRISDKERDANGAWSKKLPDGTDRPEGAGLALREMLLGMQEFAVDDNDVVPFTEDHFRELNKKVGSSIGIWGVNLKNKGIFQKYLTGERQDSTGGVFAAAQQLGLLTQYRTLQDAMKSNEREQVAQIIGSLATEGSYTDSQGSHLLEESDIGRRLILANRKTHAKKVGNINLTSGDDDKMQDYVKQMDPAELARAINASTESAPQMVVKALEGLVKNLPTVQQGANETAGQQFNRKQFEDVLARIAETTTTQGQIDRMESLLDEDLVDVLVSAENRNKFGTVDANGNAQLNPEGRAALAAFKAGIVEAAKNNKHQLEIEKEQARLQAQANARNNGGNPPAGPNPNP